MISKTRFNSTICIAFVLSACALPACAADTSLTGDAPDPADPTLQPQGGNGGGPEHVPGEILVKWKAGASQAGKGRARGKVNGAFADSAGDVELVTLPPGLAISAAARDLSADSDVEFAEPNFVYHHQADQYLDDGTLWGMGASGGGSSATTAWAANPERGSNCADAETKEPLYVGVIDEGIFLHDDLAANLDTSLNRDFTKRVPAAYTSVSDPHGTHVSGTIGGVANNGIGVSGVCGSGIKMFSAKFLGKTGGTTLNAIKAVNWVTEVKNSGKKVIASNNSWGGGGYSQALYDAIKAANTAGILFIAAAGNDGRLMSDTAPSYPASYGLANIISVGAIASDGKVAGFSNFGVDHVDLGAPGVAIMSTLPSRTGGTYGSYNGTSMATPHVTGAAVLYAARHPGATAADIKGAIESQAKPNENLAGKTAGGGRQLDVSGF